MIYFILKTKYLDSDKNTVKILNEWIHKSKVFSITTIEKEEQKTYKMIVDDKYIYNKEELHLILKIDVLYCFINDKDLCPSALLSYLPQDNYFYNKNKITLGIIPKMTEGIGDILLLRPLYNQFYIDDILITKIYDNLKIPISERIMIKEVSSNFQNLLIFDKGKIKTIFGPTMQRHDLLMPLIPEKSQLLLDFKKIPITTSSTGYKKEPIKHTKIKIKL